MAGAISRWFSPKERGFTYGLFAAVGGGIGRWALTLDDGATWVQTDGAYINTPKPGAKVHIKRGALGSYLANVNGGLGFKVRRENR